MVPGVAGSNPVIRPSYKNTGVSAGIFITPVGSGFEPAKKPFEPQQKGGRKYAGCAHAQGATRDGVVYSIAQAWSNTYEPVLSLYVVFAGAYIIHDPPGLDARQLVAVPADV